MKKLIIFILLIIAILFTLKSTTIQDKVSKYFLPQIMTQDKIFQFTSYEDLKLLYYRNNLSYIQLFGFLKLDVSYFDKLEILNKVINQNLVSDIKKAKYKSFENYLFFDNEQNTYSLSFLYDEQEIKDFDLIFSSVYDYSQIDEIVCLNDIECYEILMNTPIKIFLKKSLKTYTRKEYDEITLYCKFEDRIIVLETRVKNQTKFYDTIIKNFLKDIITNYQEGLKSKIFP